VPLVASHPRFAGYSAAVAEALVSGPYEIAVVTREPDTDPLVAAAVRHAPPGAVVVAGAPDQDGVPLLADRPYVNDGPAAYVCRNFTCDRPVTTPEEVRAALTP
jgi:hypothetical protein